MSSKAYQEAYRNMTEKQKDIMHDLYMKAVNHDGHSWNMFCDIEDAVAGIVKAQQWIPCSERCPEHRIYVLVTYKPVYGLPDIGITYYNGNKWDAPKDGTPRKVIAWMPLPTPYQEGDDKHEG